jgi:hypothetical protein
MVAFYCSACGANVNSGAICAEHYTAAISPVVVPSLPPEADWRMVARYAERAAEWLVAGEHDLARQCYRLAVIWARGEQVHSYEEFATMITGAAPKEAA